MRRTSGAEQTHSISIASRVRIFAWSGRPAEPLRRRRRRRRHLAEDLGGGVEAVGDGPRVRAELAERAVVAQLDHPRSAHLARLFDSLFCHGFSCRFFIAARPQSPSLTTPAARAWRGSDDDDDDDDEDDDDDDDDVMEMIVLIITTTAVPPDDPPAAPTWGAQRPNGEKALTETMVTSSCACACVRACVCARARVRARARERTGLAGRAALSRLELIRVDSHYHQRYFSLPLESQLSLDPI